MELTSKCAKNSLHRGCPPQLELCKKVKNWNWRISLSTFGPLLLQVNVFTTFNSGSRKSIQLSELGKNFEKKQDALSNFKRGASSETMCSTQWRLHSVAATKKIG